MKPQKFSTSWGGKDLTIEVGKLAQQANGSCLVTLGGTTVLGAATISDSVRQGIDYFPLMVDFEERLYAAGKIKGSRFIKREGRPSDEAILTGRLVDRGIRPLFDENVRNDVQVIVTALSFDGENDPDIISIIAASCALAMSDIPWNGPIAGIRIGRMNGALAVNPSYEDRIAGDLDLVISGTPDRVLMLEAAAKEVPEDVIEEAIHLGQKEMAPVMALIEKVVKAVGKEKRAVLASEESADLIATVDTWLEEKFSALLFGTPLASKHERAQALYAVKDELSAFLTERSVEESQHSGMLRRVKPVMERVVTRAILDSGKRVDGRSIEDIRPLSVEVALLPRTHGSGLFSRGETQVLSVVTLGAPGLVQTLDTMEESGFKRYMHHYNFPPYSVGETGPMRGPGRREIGHGALAERALEPVLPAKEDFPYAFRVVSEVLTSNGSSSMASTCGSTLALMDAGVPIKKPVAGVAMGLASENDFKRWKVITDLQDLEDGAGGMDFKITGTRDGVTAMQLDTKTLGLPKEVVHETLSTSAATRAKILDAMHAVIEAPRPDLSPYAPRITTITIPVDRIRDVIGPGGKVINEIIAATGVQIDIDQSGLVMVTGTDGVNSAKAVEWIKSLTHEIAVGETFEGKVTRLFEFGAMVQISPNKEGLVHISELADWHVPKVTVVVNAGDVIPVKVISVDDQGRVNLSLKAMRKTEPPADLAERQAAAQAGGGGSRDRDDRRGGGGPRRGGFSRGRR
ncbi:MAG: polyribonucleotide nucleotidyltransferase [bacterium]|nr:polyribonucleotide nucleotidyltransferase [bacterium]